MNDSPTGGLSPLMDMRIRLTKANDRIKVLEDAIELDLNDAKFNCGKHNDIKAPYCEAYISRGLTCSDCSMQWLHHSEEAIAAADKDGK